jgi:hypothetical protein
MGIKVWETPFEELRWPMLTNLRMGPLERASDESIGHPQWAAARMFALAPAGAFVGQWLQSFRASANSRRARSLAASTSIA